MFTVFYTFVSAGDAPGDGEIAEMQKAGFLPTMTFEEKPGNNMLRATQRPGFSELMRSLARITVSETKRLIVTRLDRLGRDAEDVLVSVRELHKMGVEVIVLQLGRDGLMSPASKATLTTLIAVAEMGRNTGTPRAKAPGEAADAPNFGRDGAVLHRAA